MTRDWEKAVALVMTSHSVRHSAGYILLYLPMHPATRQSPYVYEHRIIAERTLGRFLRPDEQIHHLNGVKDDNRPENITVLSAVQHVKEHLQVSDDEVSRLLGSGWTFRELQKLGVSTHRIVRLRRDMGIRNGYRTHCKRGHEFTSETTGYRRGRRRFCRVCERMRRRKVAA